MKPHKVSKNPSSKREQESKQEKSPETKKSFQHTKKSNPMQALKDAGLVAAYEHLLASLSKNGLPKGDLFEYAAYTVLNFERKVRHQKVKEINDKALKQRELKKRRQEMNDEDDLGNKLNRSVDQGKLSDKLQNKPSVINRSKSAKKIQGEVKASNLNKSDTKLSNEKKFPEPKKGRVKPSGRGNK